MVITDPLSSSSYSLSSSSSSVEPQDFSRAHYVNRKLGRGVNFGNAFDAECRPGCGNGCNFVCTSFPLTNALTAPERGSGGWDACWGNPIRDEHFNIIKAAGFESVRLPVRWAEKASDTPPYTIPPAFMASVKATVDKAIAAGFPVVLNMHHFNELYDQCTPSRGDLARQTEKFVELWRQIADEFKNYSDDYLVFEILNEPRGKVTRYYNDELLAKAWPVIRETNPNRTLMINPWEYGHYTALPRPAIPNRDPNVILSGHYYLPQNFTHQGESGNPIAACTMHWGTEAERQTLKDDIERVYNTLKSKYVNSGTGGETIPINIGEFGVTRLVPEEAERAAWLALAVEEFEKRGFSWHYWAFPNGGNYDGYCYGINNNTIAGCPADIGCSSVGWKQNILNALIPQEVP